MRLKKLTVLPFLLMLNLVLVMGGPHASTLDWSARPLAADDSVAKCGATCQEKRDVCYAQCKTSDNPKICQGGCLDTYKNCRGTCGK